MTPAGAGVMLLTALLAACAKPSQNPAPRVNTTNAGTVPGQPGAGEPAAPALMVGTYTYMADAATFTHCATDTRYPVAFEGDHISLERAYTATPHEPGAPLLVTVQGRFETRPPMEGEPREHLIVDRFDAIWPEETCQKSGVETPLRNTYWRLVDLNGSPVATHEDQREVHILLRHDETTVRGFAGCNSFTGGFVLEGADLRFEKMAATLAACPYLDEESAFLKALESVRSYRILGETLVLSGDTGRVARFRAVYF